MRYDLTLETVLPFEREAVFDLLLDMRNDPEWVPLVRGVSILEGEPPAAGTVFRVGQWVGPGRYREIDIRVEAADRPELIRWACDDPVMRYRSEIRLEPHPRGTRLIQHNTNELRGSRAPRWFLTLAAWFTFQRQFRGLRRALRDAAGWASTPDDPS